MPHGVHHVKDGAPGEPRVYKNVVWPRFYTILVWGLCATKFWTQYLATHWTWEKLGLFLRHNHQGRDILGMDSQVPVASGRMAWARIVTVNRLAVEHLIVWVTSHLIMQRCREGDGPAVSASMVRRVTF